MGKAATPDTDVFTLYYGNAAAYAWFADHPHIWRDGFNGRQGMDYTQIESALRLERYPPREKTDLFMRLRALESGYMTAFYEQQKKA